MIRKILIYAFFYNEETITSIRIIRKKFYL
mgnify:CR=1 FL=1